MMLSFNQFLAAVCCNLWTFLIPFVCDFSQWTNSVSTYSGHPIDLVDNFISTGRQIDDTISTIQCDVYSDDLSGTIQQPNQTIKYSPGFLRAFETTPPGCDERSNCGISEDLCKHLDSLDLLRHPCPFHNSTCPSKHSKPRRKKGWQKRGKRGGKKRRQFTPRPIPVVTNFRPVSSTSNQSAIDHSVLRPLERHNNRNLTVHLWNARSVRNKTIAIIDDIIDNDIDLFIITETWLAEDDPVVIGELLPPGYSFMSFPRKSDEHGGLGIIHKTQIGLQIFPTNVNTVYFEHASVLVKNTGLRIIPIYRPPPSQENGFKTNDFLEEFETFLDEICLNPVKTILLGDFNVHVDTPSKPDARRFLDALTAHCLHQHVDQATPTHKDGHTLDLILSRLEDGLIHDCCVLPTLGSDHSVIDCTINCSKPAPLRISSTVRKTKNINIVSFSNDLEAEINSLDFQGNVDELLDKFNLSMSTVLDAHAPPIQRSRIVRPRLPWYNDEINTAKRERRRSERKWRKTKCDIDYESYINQSNTVNKLIQCAKEDYYKDILNNSDSKRMYSTLNNLLNKNTKQLPDADSLTDLCDSFAEFFTHKVNKIREELDGMSNVQCNNDSTYIMDSAVSNIVIFDEFQYVSADDIKEVVLAMPNKSCSLDIIPMWLLKDNIDCVIEPLTTIVNDSFRTGVFPSRLREAVVSPILKKASLDKNSLKNYRPVSNICYLSKIMEKLACVQIRDHLNTYDLFEEFQSAYRQRHSTETALLRVKTDIMDALDVNKAVALVLLDLSAAFDTVDHHILSKRLSETFRISGTALQWISSYLEDRSFRVCIGDESSAKRSLNFGLPQGSVVGPLFFSMYTHCIGSIIRKHDICYHLYADDVQLYLTFNPKVDSEREDALARLVSCIDEISAWMTVNKLKLNNDKSEFFVAASAYNAKYVRDICLRIGNETIMQSTKIRNLGVIFDQTLSMSEHVKATVKTVNFHLRSIYRIRRYITQDSCHHLVRALISSRLDYANSLMLGISAADRKQLQKLQNRAARIVFKAERLHPSAPLLKCLHWLPIEQRIKYKVLLVVYKSINGLAPPYLDKFLVQYSSGRENLRSGDDPLLLSIPRTIRNYGDKSFHAAAPRLWNSLPATLRNSSSVTVFRKQLKTFLFPPG